MDELQLTLPSGLTVRVRRLGDGAPLDADDFRGERFFHGRLYRAVDEGRVSLERRDSGDVLTVDDLDGLLLPDFHALRDAVQRVGAIARDGGPWLCRNCDGEVQGGDDLRPSVDLGYWYVEDVPLADPPNFSLTKHGPALKLVPTTARDARPFHRAALQPTLRLSGPVVRAMGIVGLGELTDAQEIARASEELSDDAWVALLAAYEDLAYSPKSYFPVLCPNCDTLHDMPAPPDRATCGAWATGEADSPFLEEDEFAALALETGGAVYRAMGVQNIELEVVTGTADVDGTGEPLLGSYQPQVREEPSGVPVGSTELPFLIRVYYRTFARMYEDRPYDVAEELRETIAHEVQHHLHYLEGYDPMDDAEREAAIVELERTYGKRAMRRARASDAALFVKRLGWLAVGSLFCLGIVVLFLHLTGGL